jgi:hypothetical protein
LKLFGRFETHASASCASLRASNWITQISKGLQACAVVFLSRHKVTTIYFQPSAASQDRSEGQSDCSCSSAVECPDPQQLQSLVPSAPLQQLPEPAWRTSQQQQACRCLLHPQHSCWTFRACLPLRSLTPRWVYAQHRMLLLSVIVQNISGCPARPACCSSHILGAVLCEDNQHNLLQLECSSCPGECVCLLLSVCQC